MAENSYSPGDDDLTPKRNDYNKSRGQSFPHRTPTNPRNADRTVSNMDRGSPLNTEGSNTLTPRSGLSALGNKNGPTSFSGAESARHDTAALNLSPPKHRRGAMPTADHFVPPHSMTRAATHPHEAMRSAVDAPNDTMARGSESLLTAGTMGSKNTVGKAGPMTYAAVLASSSPTASPATPKRDKQQLRGTYPSKSVSKFLEREKSSQPKPGLDNVELHQNFENRQPSSSLARPQQPDPDRDTKLEYKGTTGRRGRRAAARKQSREKRAAEFAEFSKAFPKTGYTLANLPVDGRDLNSEARIESNLPGPPSSNPTLREMPTNVRKVPSLDIDEFTKRYPKTGRTEIQELTIELEQLLPCDGWKGHGKLNTLIAKCNTEISELELNLTKECKTPNKSAAEIVSLQNTTRAAIRGLEERKSQLYTLKKEHAERASEESPTGSFVTANEGSYSDSMSYQTAFSSSAVGRENVGKAERISDESGNSGVWKGKEKAAEQQAPDKQTKKKRSEKMSANPPNNSTQRKALNFDSPAFTPAAAANGTLKGNHPTLSSQAAAAAPFTPRALSTTSTPNPQQRESDPISSLNIARIPEFTPSYDMSSTSSQTGANGTAADAVSLQFDPFSMSSVTHALPSTPYNPYMEDGNGLAADPMNSYYPAQNNFVQATQPLQYHLYAPQGPGRDDLLPYQRQAHEFFIPENLRQSFQRRAEATLQVMPHSQLPVVEPYHSLVALDTNQHQNTQLFNYPSWIYKCLSQKTGHYYCLRRLEGYRATNDRAIRCVKDWRRVDGTHVVKIHDAFTTRAYGDSSLVIVTDYHPLSKTLAEHHFGSRTRTVTNVHETVLWSYTVQISLALKEIHQSNLAARCIDPSKVILTDKNRIRLNACAVLDVVEFELARPLVELQQEDFHKFGKLVLSIATHTPVAQLPSQAALDQLARDFSSELVEVVRWLIFPPADPTTPKSIPTLFSFISLHTADVLSKLYSAQDNYTTEFFKEIENSRLTRLVFKLNFINERPEFAHNPDWAETGDRYVLKLMRDFIFHQVDADGRPNVDLGWVVGCLNKLDAGSNEMFELSSRDGNSVFVVSWKEVKAVVAKTWAELSGGGAGGSGGGGSGGGSGGRRR